MTKKRAMTKKQQRFCEEYLTDLNATQAALRAGYAESGAGQEGFRLLKKAEIRAAIQDLMNDRSKATKITAERVLHELARIGFANMAEYISVRPDGSAVVDLSTLTPDTAAAIQEVTSEVYMEGMGKDATPVKRVKLKLHARSRALELLGKHLAMFTDRIEVGMPDVKIVVTGSEEG